MSKLSTLPHPTDGNDQFSFLLRERREEVVATYAAYCIAVGDEIFRVENHEDPEGAYRRMLQNAVDGANVDAEFVREGRATLSMVVNDGEPVRRAQLTVRRPNTKRNSDIASVLVTAYTHVSGVHPKTVREALKPVLGS